MDRKAYVRTTANLFMAPPSILLFVSAATARRIMNPETVQRNSHICAPERHGPRARFDFSHSPLRFPFSPAPFPLSSFRFPPSHLVPYDIHVFYGGCHALPPSRPFRPAR